MSNTIVSGDRTLSFEDLLRRASQAARGLEEQVGIAKGDTLAVFLRNDFSFFEATVAASLLGAYLVPINWHYSAEETRYILENSNAKALVVHADMLPNIKAGIPDSVSVFVVDTPAEIADTYGIKPVSAKGHTNWDEWLAGFEQLDERQVASPGAMIYTSGTTGRPKGVRRTPSTPEEMALLYEIVGIAFGIEPGIRTIIPAPMYHSAPNTYASLSVTLGAGQIVLMPRFEPEEFLRLIEKYKITHVQTVPTMFVRLLKLPKEVREKYDVSSLEFVVHAAAPCAPEVKQQMIEWWGPVINEYYGATEVGTVVFCSSEEWLANKGTVGKAMPNVELRVLNEDGEDQPVNVPGDVYCRIKGSTDFTYYGDDEKRKDAEKHGLISVGDIGYLNEDGFLFLCDRRNDMVISGGTNIYPAEIEAELINHSDIADCAVFGIPDDDFGEALCACIQPQEGREPNVEDIRAWLRERLASYKVPKVIELRADLPREDSGKIFKRKLRGLYWEKAGRSI